jgi:hypothetical protein
MDLLNTLIAWMDSPYENSGTWVSVDWWDSEMPEGMVETIKELCAAEPRANLIQVRNGLPQLVVEKKELEEKWGKLPEGELCRYLKSDLIVLRHLNDSIGIDDNPIGSYENIKELLDFVIDLDLSKSVW